MAALFIKEKYNTSILLWNIATKKQWDRVLEWTAEERRYSAEFEEFYIDK